MRYLPLVFLCIGFLSTAVPAFAAGPVSPDPVYVSLGNGSWKGLFPHGGQYAEFTLSGKKVEPQDPYHILLEPKLALMITFADKKQFAEGKSAEDLLKAHIEWETDYWRKQASRVETVNRDDLRGGKRDIRVTEMTVHNQKSSIHAFIVALAAREGVFVFSISPADKHTPSIVKTLVQSIQLVDRQLDGDELMRISKSESSK